MRHWSPWDEQLLRVLRGEYRHDAPDLSFAHGAEGGVAVFHLADEIGLWVAASRHRYHYLLTDGTPATQDPCDIMDIVPLSRALFSDFLDTADGGLN
jgi:hypothetical protein